jgi:2,4-dichlorophenol 6-monooxygenase
VCRSLAPGGNEANGKVFHRLEALGGWPGTDLHNTIKKNSACYSTNLPQIRLEPLLSEIAQKRSNGGIHYSHQVLDAVNKDDHVLVTVKNVEKGTTFQVKADFVVAADGGKTIGPKVRSRLDIVRHYANAFKFSWVLSSLVLGTLSTK